MTDDRRQTIEQRLEQITPGPWRLSMTGYTVKSNNDDMPIVANNPWGVHMTEKQCGPWIENAEFIAHAPEDIRYLLDLVQSLQTRVDQQAKDAEQHLNRANNEIQRRQGAEIAYTQSEQKRLVLIDKLNAAEARAAQAERELKDAEQQLEVLRPGGLYAWKSKYEAAEARCRELERERDEARGIQRLRPDTVIVWENWFYDAAPAPKEDK